MRSSTAFEVIDDPHDPAWDGHVPEVDDRRARALRLGAVVVAVLVVTALVVWLVARGGGGTAGDDRSGAAEPGAKVVPSAVLAEPAPAPDGPAGGDDDESAVPDTPAPGAAAEPGSGWAPAAATVAPEDLGSGLLEGDMAGIHPELIRRLDAVAVSLDREVEVLSGWRTRHEQESLYQRYQAGTGNLAAVPGTSLHESGRAADVYVDGVALADVEGARAAAAAVGLHFPVAGEAWHVEMVGSS
jgi:hypothetical protein